MGAYCCKSKKGDKNSEPFGSGFTKDGEANQERPVVELKDFIFECKFENGFKQYMETNFELKNLEKYLLVEKGGIFTLDLIIKVFMASFVWKNIIYDHL